MGVSLHQKRFQISFCNNLENKNSFVIFLYMKDLSFFSRVHSKGTLLFEVFIFCNILMFFFLFQKKRKSDAMSSADDLISDDNRFFKWTVQISAMIFGVLVVGGLLFEYCYLRPRHRMIVSARSKKTVYSFCHCFQNKNNIFFYLEGFFGSPLSTLSICFVLVN